jgi:hypothetical protein
MFAVLVTTDAVATVFGVTRNAKTARELFADAVAVLLETRHAGCVHTADAGEGYACLFNSRNEIVTTVKVEAVTEY